ncbi:MAG: CHAT domain-containing protein [Deltaproteobacteria bacterium]|nr:CHAT domain-containing protein [Deltaproteobacteria bacterium]
MCAIFATADAETQISCRMACKVWPQSSNCGVLRRFGHAAWAYGAEIFAAIRAGKPIDVPAVDARFPHLRVFLEYRVMPPGFHPPWRTPAQREAVNRGAAALGRFARLDAAGQYREAVSAAVAAETAMVEGLGQNHPIVAIATNNVALGQWHAGDYAAAAATFRRALAAVAGPLGEEDPFLATLHDNLGTVLAAQGDAEAALAASQRSLALIELLFGPDAKELANVHNNIATAHYLRGDPRSALVSAHAALAQAERPAVGVPAAVLGHILGNLATIYAALGDVAGARRYHERDLRHTEATVGAEHPDFAHDLGNYATLLYRLGDLAQARALLERALGIYAASVGNRHPNYAEVLANLSAVRDAQGDAEAAKGLLEEAIRIRERALGPTHPDLGLSLNNLAGLLGRLGDKAGALVANQRALAIYERAYGSESAKLSVPLHNIGILQIARGEKAEGLQSLRRALALRERQNGKDDPDLAPHLEVLAVAEAFVSGADAWPRMHRAAALRRVAFWRAAEAADSDAQLLSRSALDDDAIAILLALGWRGGHDTALWAELLDRTGRAARAERQRRQQARAAASAGSAAAPVDLAASPTATCAVLRREGAAMIHWLRAEPLPLFPGLEQAQWRALVVRPQGQRCSVQRIDLAAAAAVDAAIERFRAAVAGVEEALRRKRLVAKAEADLSKAAAALHALVWAPLEPALAGATRGYLVPDRRLYEVPLGALPAADGRPPLRTMELAWLPVPAALAAPLHGQAAKAAQATSGALVVGQLDHGAAAGSPAQAQAAWQRCGKRCAKATYAGPAAAASVAARGGRRACGWGQLHWGPVGGEAADVAQTLGAAWRGQPVWLVQGDAGEERALAAAMPHRRVLHFGTHGFFAPAAGCAGRVEHQRAGLMAEAPPRRGLDPMQLSALVLSGANRVAPDAPSEADGALSAREIVGLDLGAVEVATLAACETGRGATVAGEGPQGLGKAFLVAGVREVLVSLWQVPEQATAQLMRSFYGRLPRRGEAGQAVRALIATQREAVAKAGENSAAALFSWGAFVPLTSAPVWSATPTAKSRR